MAFATITPVGPSWDAVADRLVRDLKAANRTVGRQVADVGRKAMLADVKARRGTLRFGGGRLNVKTKVKATAAGATVEFAGVSAGAWAIISTGTKPHTIRVKRPRSLHWGGDGFAVSVQHPGTTGRNYWAFAGRALDEAVADIVGDVYDDALAA